MATAILITVIVAFAAKAFLPERQPKRTAWHRRAQQNMMSVDYAPNNF